LFQTAKALLVRFLRAFLTYLDPSDLTKLFELEDQLAKAKNQVSLLESILKKETGLLGTVQRELEDLEFHRSGDQRELVRLKDEISNLLSLKSELETKLSNFSNALSIPDGPYILRALELVKQFDKEEQGGEWKRHQVYARLLREFPEVAKPILGAAIELAIYRFKS
jgi:hypothetical protein